MRIIERFRSTLIPTAWTLVLLLLLLPAFAAAQEAKDAEIQPTSKPLLWRIEGEKPSYVFGTIHLPDKKVLALSAPVHAALESVDAFYAEIPMEEMGRMANFMMLPDGATLKEILPEDLYKRASDYMRSKGYPIAMFNRFKVWVLMSQLAVLDYIKDMAVRQPLDLQLYSEAQKRGQEVGGLETIEEQVEVFEGLTQEEQIDQLALTLDQLEEEAEDGVTFSEKLIRLYLDGDPQLLMNFMNESYDPDDPTDVKMIERLIHSRNRLMADRIAKKLRDNPETSYFFAFGAGHLYGETGVVTLLRQKGFTLARLVARASQ